MPKYAYVTFVMRNDSFIPGALVFAYALRKQNTPHDLVCIVSKGVTEYGKQALKTLYTHVIDMEEVYVAHNNRHERQDRPFLFTRFNAFLLGEDGGYGLDYEKIVLADADVLPIRNYDTLFELETPAGIINEYKEHCMEYHDGKYIKPNTVEQYGTWIWHDVYTNVPHGTLVPKDMTNRVLQDSNNMGILAALYVLTPSSKTYKDIMQDTKNPDIAKKIANFKWPEMQYLTQEFSGKWHNIDLRYASFNGYPDIKVLYGTHFAGVKPWQMNNKSVNVFGRFDDYTLWYHVYQKMIQEYPSLIDNNRLKKLLERVKVMTKKPKYQFKYQDNELFKHLIK
ncbi:MAG: hypothetical protein K9L26_01455 [Candidatus Izimaplasma sp.]|nr:hypothetical protein [Candidatus Izimaplasma bacterium]